MTIRTDANGVMVRPDELDDFVKRRAAELALPQIKAWWNGDASDADIIYDLMKVGLYSGDGYEIAKDLESRCYWDVDAELVEALNGSFSSDACEELTKKWVTCVGLKLEIPIGAKVTCKKQVGNAKGECGEGEVVKLYPDTACYGVRYPWQPLTSNYIVFAENVEEVK